jgi:hypothetical protein
LILHPAVDAILKRSNVDEAISAARAAASAGILDDAAWLTIADGAESAAIEDPCWLALSILAHEQRSGAMVNALVKRVRLIVRCGADAVDPFRNSEEFFDGVRRYLEGDSSERGLRMYQRSLDAILAAERTSPEWIAARDCFLRSRHLREIGIALRDVADAGLGIPNDLISWLEWANVREEDGKIVQQRDQR